MSAPKDSPGNGAVKLAEPFDTLSDSPDEVSDQEGRTTEGNGHAAVQGERGVGENHDEHTGKGKDEDDEDDEGDDDDDEDDEDNEEPALKYQRIGGALPELLKKDSASALTISNRLMALGTHAGIVHILDLAGNRTKSFKPHQASVSDICMDSTADFVATASIDGQVIIHSLSTPESYAFDMKRPMRTVCLEPDFSRRSSRAFVCGGMADRLVLHEKGWLGHKETLLNSGEGPIWHVRWNGSLIAWANDLGVKIYDTTSQTRIGFIDRPKDSPRADLFKCTLLWQDEATLLIGWADHIQVARVKTRPRNVTGAAPPGLPPLLVEVTAVFQVDCMISGIVPHPTPPEPSPLTRDTTSPPSTIKSYSPPLTSFLVLAYIPPPTDFSQELTSDRSQQRRQAAERPELRIITRAGEELTADALSLTGFERWSCGDYVLRAADEEGDQRSYVVMSPKDVIIARPRDAMDHVAWLVERHRYEEALEAVEKIGGSGVLVGGSGEVVDATEIGQRYIRHLVADGDFVKAARLCPRVCGQNQTLWEDWIFVFAEQKQLQVIIPYVPTESPRLGHLVYEMMLAHFLTHDRQTLLRMIKEWPKQIYDISAVIVAVQSELDRIQTASSSTSTNPESAILMECLAELYISNRQPGKALPFYLRLRRPNVFDLIRENNLFTDVQDQALLLVEFDHELMEKRKLEGVGVDAQRSDAVTLLVDHIHSIPIGRVVQQLQSRPYYLFLYLDALFNKDPHLASSFADLQVKLFAEFATTRLIDFLRASNYYSLEAAYKICNERDLVPEMVFLLGRMGNNKRALTLIIERLGDVNRAIDFAKEQNDDDLWEDLLKYSETRPPFIRGLLENVGADIDPIRLIRRIKNGLEIPGLKEALIKILQDFNLQLSLLEGCQAILHGDGAALGNKLRRDQNAGFFITAKTQCPICAQPLTDAPQSLILLFLCRHVVHATCVSGAEDLDLPRQPELALIGMGDTRGIGAKIAFASGLKAKIASGCPVCYKKGEGERTRP